MDTIYTKYHARYFPKETMQTSKHVIIIKITTMYGYLKTQQRQIKPLFCMESSSKNK